jgi:hypothetical protein
MSGTTTRLPVKIVLSPGLAMSTIAPLRITSMERGILPAGISPECSCTLSFCQSMNEESVLSNSHLVLLLHFSLAHLIGSVNLNYCSTPVETSPHSWHLNAPSMSSGLTSVVRVTVPCTDIRRPRHCTFRSRILFIAGIL